MEKKIAILPGDGVGKEVSRGAVTILQAVSERFGHTFQYVYGKIGGTAIDEYGTPLPEHTLDLCKGSDAVLLGAVGGPKWDQLPGHIRPEKGLLKIRKELELYANVRPVQYYRSISGISPLRKEVVEGADMVVVRELTGGLYFGKPSERTFQEGKASVVDTLFYQKNEMERVIRYAFELATTRSGKVTSVDKANVLESSRMWRETAEEIASEFPDVKLEHMLVDNAAMQLIKNPRQFDVIVTENLFGDILSDEASVLTGSLGMLPSASVSAQGPNLYEPIHGSAPDIAGRNAANPIAMILSVAMMLRMSFGLVEEAEAVENAVKQVLEAGSRTSDIASTGVFPLTTEQMAEEIKAALLDNEAIFHIMGAYA
ncbi:MULTISPECIES: 3-isopropylmalate dehydrogenase [Mesobacillus]|uniref:3-isopropylmalate dehydrogenase n=2 Tax=Mesobacillus TaxID=2675231 RepID=A0A0D6ZAP2_9BACI|nr:MULTISPECIES: 3-isopropylmalate dehydrogenase [Mesobacillus]KIY22405.1 3-isopropylmalate dehydrogenase [Mesobacillus subterraneus]MDQ0414149.1 3-isopropylmalate dehydrogenase [Mesobacillus stamsii]